MRSAGDFKPTIMTRSENYRIKERADEAIKEHGSIDNAIKKIKQELHAFENAWSNYSSDCLGHAITCNRLLIDHLKSQTI